MLVRIFEENGLKITSTALSGYMKKLSTEVEGVSVRGERKGKSQPSTRPSEVRGHLAMKPDVPL